MPGQRATSHLMRNQAGASAGGEIRAMAKSAYRQFYFSPSYFKKIVSDPRNYFFNRFDPVHPRDTGGDLEKRWIK